MGFGSPARRRIRTPTATSRSFEPAVAPLPRCSRPIRRSTLRGSTFAQGPPPRVSASRGPSPSGPPSEAATRKRQPLDQRSTDPGNAESTPDSPDRDPSLTVPRSTPLRRDDQGSLDESVQRPPPVQPIRICPVRSPDQPTDLEATARRLGGLPSDLQLIGPATADRPIQNAGRRFRPVQVHALEVKPRTRWIRTSAPSPPKTARSAAGAPPCRAVDLW